VVGGWPATGEIDCEFVASARYGFSGGASLLTGEALLAGEALLTGEATAAVGSGGSVAGAESPPCPYCEPDESYGDVAPP